MKKLVLGVVVLTLLSLVLVSAGSQFFVNILYPSQTDHYFNNGTLNVQFNVSTQDASNTNASFLVELLINGSAGFGDVNSVANRTNANVTLNVTALADGTYNFSVRATNGSVTNTSSIFNFTVDSTLPTGVNFTSLTSTNNTNKSVDSLFVNISYTETNFANATYVVTNSSGNVNTTNTTSTFVNFTNMFDGTYTVNVTVKDLANNVNTTMYRTITLDTTNPSVSVSTSVSSLDAGGSLTLTCSVSDVIDPLPSTSFTIKKPGATSYTSVSQGSFSDTLTTGTYSLKCQGTDDAGNSATSETTFEVTSASAGSSSGSSSGGGSSSGSSSSSSSESDSDATDDEDVGVDIEDTETWTMEGVATFSDIEVGDVYNFVFDGTEDHTITVDEVSEDEGFVMLTIQSDPIELTLFVGEMQVVDIDQDGANDLEVTLDAIVDGKATLTFTQLGEWEVPVEDDVEEESSFLSWLIPLIVILIIVVIGFVWMKSRKK